ncbi:MAG: hypothetical protein AAGI70_06315 [Pseudomonadota bacterium]
MADDLSEMAAEGGLTARLLGPVAGLLSDGWAAQLDRRLSEPEAARIAAHIEAVRGELPEPGEITYTPALAGALLEWTEGAKSLPPEPGLLSALWQAALVEILGGKTDFIRGLAGLDADCLSVITEADPHRLKLCQTQSDETLTKLTASGAIEIVDFSLMRMFDEIAGHGSARNIAIWIGLGVILAMFVFGDYIFLSMMGSLIALILYMYYKKMKGESAFRLTDRGRALQAILAPGAG